MKICQVDFSIRKLKINNSNFSEAHIMGKGQSPADDQGWPLDCSNVDVLSSSKVHVLKALDPHSDGAEVMEALRGGAYSDVIYLEGTTLGWD